jgi:hypothetical protein
MRKNRVWHIIGVLAVVSILMVSALPTAVAAKPIDYSPVDVGPRIREWEATAELVKPDDSGSGASTMAVVGATPVDTKYFLILNDYTGKYQPTYFTLYDVGDGTSAQIWVQNNLAFPAGDPRVEPVITGEQMAYILAEFEENILLTESTFFGTPDMLDGSFAYLPSLLGLPADYYYDATGKAIILVSNIRDENYYDSEYPVYIAGFYSSSFETYFDRNIISIDAYDWAKRMGPSGTRPYLYEGVVAHEWQHLLHDDYDSDEDLWINEGMAEFAEILCGYTPSLQGHIDAAAARPENSLTTWGDQGDLEILTDYGLAALFQVYLWENFGVDTIQDLFHNPDNGISGVDSTLGSAGAFAEVFYDFSIALYQKGSFETFPKFQVNVGHPGKPNPEAFASPGAPPWGSDYILLWGYERIANFQFNGFQFNPLSWTSDGEVLWGGTGDLIDNWAIFDATGGGVLTFKTKYDIEGLWDFGFVQVSTDNGLTWTSLSNAYTSSDYDPNAHPNIVANLPGLTGSTGGAWVDMSFDLSAYPGAIKLAFRYMTDWATTETGWFIDDVYVGDTPISDGSSTAAFMSLNEVLGISNEYTVTLIGERTRKGKVEYTTKVILSGGYVSDWESIRNMFDNYQQLVMVVTYNAVEGVTSYADYNFQIDSRGGIHIK